MSFSFPHQVWIFQKVFSGLGLSNFDNYADWWLMLSLFAIGPLPLGLLDVDSEYGELHCEQFYPSCCFFHIDIPNWDIIIWHIWNNEVRCWGYVTHGGWWYLVIQLSLWHILPYILQPLWNLDTVPLQLSCHYSWSKFTSTHTLEGGIITTVFIIFLHIEIASQSLHTHSHILLLDISLLYCFTLHTNYSACLASKYCWAVNIMLLKLIFSNNVRSLLVYVRVQLPEASTPPAFYDYITIRPRRPISWVHFTCNVDFYIVRCWLI